MCVRAAAALALLLLGCSGPAPSAAPEAQASRAPGSEGAAAAAGSVAAAQLPQGAVGRVALVQGEVLFRSAGGTVPATEGLSFGRADTVVAGRGAFAVLQLENGHLVRIDEELELPVERLALLAAPRARAGLRAQLDRLLTEEERRAGAQRIAGWEARLSAGEALGAGGAQKKREAASPSGAGAPVPPGVAPESPAAEAGEPSPAAPDSPAPHRMPEEDGRRKRQARPQPLGKEAGWAQPPVRAPVPAAPSQPRSLAELETIARAPEVRRCLVAELEATGLHPAQVTLLLRLEGGEIRRLALDEGLSLPACARPLLEPLLGARPPGPQVGWLKIRLELP